MLKLRICDALSDVKGDWNFGVRIFLHEFVVFPHGVEECFFVAEEVVALQMIVDFEFAVVVDIADAFFLQQATHSLHQALIVPFLLVFFVFL